MRQFLLLLLVVAVVRAEPAGFERFVRRAAPKPIDFEKWTIDDVVNQESASDFRFSPDSRSVVWVKSTPDKDRNEQVGQLFRADLARLREVQLTRGSESCTSPRWSPDGNHIAFLSSRPVPKTKGEKKSKPGDESKTQVWLLDATGGEPWVLTESSRNVQQLDWADASTILFSAQEDANQRETFLRDEQQDTTTVVEDDRNEPPVRLFRVEIKTKKVTRLSDNKDRIEQFAVSPDGTFAVAVHSRSMRYLYDNKIKPIVYIHNLSTGKHRQVLSNPKFNISALAWAPDSKGFYATHEDSSNPQLAQAGITQLYYHDLGTEKETAIELD
jgi:Tol biopolymer transport system component